MLSPTAPPRRRHRVSLVTITVLAAMIVPVAAVSVPGPVVAATPTLKNVTANLFEWNWPSVAAECATVLGPDGYAAVQVAPPEDSLKASGNPWWQVYQPVDGNLTSMMGTPAQFSTMVSTCHNAGVKVYVDAVLNHMAAQSGSGTSFGGQAYNPSTLTYPAYTSVDFHSYPANCPESNNSIDNWLNYTDVTECQLEGLPDLATETTHVRTTQAAYLNSLISLGVDGFRLDSASSIGETDIAAMEALLHPDTLTGAPVYITQEVYPGSAGQDARLNPSSFEPDGSVTSFDYSFALSNDFENNNIAALNTFSPLLPSAYASSFVTNHDTERASSTLHYTNGAQYTLADEFLLAYGYGTPQIYSSFTYGSADQGPPADGSGNVTNTVCGQGTWECTEQLPGIVAMVGWHNLALTNNDPVTNWTTAGNNVVAFSRGSDAWIAINNSASPVTGTFPTGLANGSYCDIVHHTISGSACSGPAITVTGGSATVTIPAVDAIAFDVKDLVTSTTPPPPNTNLARGATMTASSTASGYPASNANDNDTSTYWESSNGAFPQTLTANLGTAQSLGSVTLDLPPATAWSTRTETLAVLGSTDGGTWTTLVPPAGYTFDPATGNTTTISLPSGTTKQYLQLQFTANTGWPAGQISEFQIFRGTTSGGTPTLTALPTSLSFPSTTVGSTSAAQSVTVRNTGTAAAVISSVSAGPPFAETNTCGSSLAAGASCTVSVTFTPTATGAAAGTLSVAGNAPVSVALSGTGAANASTNLALNAPITASSVQQTYVAAHADDGNTSSYWEGTNGAWPTTLTVNLGTSQALGSVVIDLPPSASWSTRTQTLSMLGSTNNSTWTTLVGSATYTFNPATGNTVTIALPAGSTDQYVRLAFTANSVQNGAQASELAIYGR